MKCIVTGGAGFIGSHIAELLVHHGYGVVVLDNFSTGRRENLSHLANKVTIVECDLSIQSDWQKQFIGVDYVFHLAALADIVPSIQNPGAYFESNVVGTFNVLTAARSNNVKRFIYSASSSCYGIPSIFPTPEIADINPQYPYALTKRLGEELVLHWAQIYDFPATSLRFFNVYGPRSRTSGTYGAVFGVFLAQKLAGKPLTIVGDGLQTRDFTYVTDVVDALYVAALSSTKGEVFNVGSGTTISVNTLAKLLGGETVHIPKRPGEPDCTFADIKKIKNKLGWEPKVSISDGVESLLKNISYWENAPVWTPESINIATADWFKYLTEK
jgi:UDP-glucose 4-epimerase